MKKITTLCTIAVVLLSACVREDFFGRSGLKQIRYFTLENQSGSTRIIEDSLIIRITVSSTAEMNRLKPDSVLLSTYATLIPGIETYRDFSTPQVYSVRAEDGSEASYTIFVTKEGANPQLENNTFDAWYTPAGKNYEEPGSDPASIWASGNAGVVTINTANVTPLLITGSDKAARLVTKDLGTLGQLVGQRMGAGSIFTGKFELDIANPLNSTKFGIPFSAKPVSFSVEYTYQPGTPYRNNRGQELSKPDSCDIYLILENREQANPRRVATAWFRSPAAVSSFQRITVPLVYGALPSSAPAYSIPANGLYGDANLKVTHLTWVAASSASGALFEGGTNSTLTLNNVNLNY